MDTLTTLFLFLVALVFPLVYIRQEMLEMENKLSITQELYTLDKKVGTSERRNEDLLRNFVTLQEDITDIELQIKQLENRDTLKDEQINTLKTDLLKMDECRDQCLPGWLRRGGRCFTVILDQQSDWSWLQALQTCAAMNATLMELDTAAEQEYLAEVSSTNDRHLWLGGTDWFKEGSWIWLSGKPMTVRWGSGQPNGNNGENCLGIYSPDAHSVHDFQCNGLFFKNAPACKKNLC